jgi:predicted RNA-binding Zn-ribbon protein involved in translation (DUF1610 family)
MCDCQIISITPIDEKTVEIKCPVHGSTMLYRFHGGWETAEQKMNRMKRVFICDQCGAEVVDYNAGSAYQRQKCDRCVEENESEAKIRFYRQRDNKNSPWRIYQQKREQGS